MATELCTEFAGHFADLFISTHRVGALAFFSLFIGIFSTYCFKTHFLYSSGFDSPDVMPSLANLSPSGLNIPNPETIPVYQLPNDPRGLAIIINNEAFVQRDSHNLEFREGSDRDACK